MPFSQCTPIFQKTDGNEQKKVNVRYVLDLSDVNIVETPMALAGFVLPLLLMLLRFNGKIRSYYWIILEYISAAVVFYMVWWDFNVSTLLIGGYIAGISVSFYFIILCIELFRIIHRWLSPNTSNQSA